MTAISSLFQPLADALDPYQEILEWNARERERMDETIVYSQMSRKESLGTVPEATEIPLTERIREFQEKLQNKKLVLFSPESHSITIRLDYYENLSKGISTTPEDFVAFFSAGKPSAITRQHLITTSGHMIGSPIPIVPMNLTNILAANLDEQSKWVDELKRHHPNLTAVLDQEVSLVAQIRSKTLMVSHCYLNSLDIPLYIKGLYPSTEQREHLIERMLNAYVEKSGLGPILAYSFGTEPENRFIKGFCDCHEYIATAYSIGVSLTLLPYYFFDVAMCQIGKLKNKLFSNKSDWTPSREEVFGKDTDRFWIYFKYHPEKDMPINFTLEDFNPTPDINPNYHPRKLFKEKVSEMYDAMARVIRYYRTHEIPLDDDILAAARNNLLKRILTIDQSCTADKIG